MPTGKPYFGTKVTTTPTWFRLSTWGEETDVSIIVASTARDPNSPNSTSILRAGLILGKITASGKYAQYNNAASDGTETAVGILVNTIDLRDSTGTQQDTPAVMATVAEIDANNIPASGTNYTGLDANAKADFAASETAQIVVRS